MIAFGNECTIWRDLYRFIIKIRYCSIYICWLWCDDSQCLDSLQIRPRPPDRSWSICTIILYIWGRSVSVKDTTCLNSGPCVCAAPLLRDLWPENNKNVLRSWGNTALKHFCSFVCLDKQIYKLNISFETFEKLKKKGQTKKKKNVL